MFTESTDYLDDWRTLGLEARYIYLYDHDRLNRLPAGRVYRSEDNYVGIVYFPGRYDQRHIASGPDRDEVTRQVAAEAARLTASRRQE